MRDYIHVRDLAEAHLLALGALEEKSRLIYNIGNGQGFTVLEVIEAVRRVTGRPIAGGGVRAASRAIRRCWWRARRRSSGSWDGSRSSRSWTRLWQARGSGIRGVMREQGAQDALVTNVEVELIESMFHLHLPVLEKLLRPVIVYLFLILFLRLFGKRELAQLNPFDLVVLLSLSNTVQNAMIGDDNSVTGGIIGAFALLAINWVLTRGALQACPRWTRWWRGRRRC